MNITYDFTGQVALVTGAGSGMGLDTARAFAKAGAAVTLAGREEEPLLKAVDEITAAGGKAIAVVCDVVDEDQVAAMVERTVATFGRLDAAYNNANTPRVACASTPCAPARSKRRWSLPCWTAGCWRWTTCCATCR